MSGLVQITGEPDPRCESAWTAAPVLALALQRWAGVHLPPDRKGNLVQAHVRPDRWRDEPRLFSPYVALHPVRSPKDRTARGGLSGWVRLEISSWGSPVFVHEVSSFIAGGGHVRDLWLPDPSLSIHMKLAKPATDISDGVGRWPSRTRALYTFNIIDQVNIERTAA